MHRRHLLTALPLLTLAADPLRGEDFAVSHKVAGLNGLRDVAIVLRANAPIEVFTSKEWADLVEVFLRRNVPDLTVRDPRSSANWLELSYVTTEQGGAVEVSLYRWVRMRSSGQEIFAKVWSDTRLSFGGVSKQMMRESVETLLTGFAADLARSRR